MQDNGGKKNSTVWTTPQWPPKRQKKVAVVSIMGMKKCNTV